MSITAMIATQLYGFVRSITGATLRHLYALRNVDKPTLFSFDSGALAIGTCPPNHGLHFRGADQSAEPWRQ
jgi:hypothetical protein